MVESTREQLLEESKEQRRRFIDESQHVYLMSRKRVLPVSASSEIETNGRQDQQSN
jgi:hypothetical protein